MSEEIVTIEIDKEDCIDILSILEVKVFEDIRQDMEIDNIRWLRRQLDLYDKFAYACGWADSRGETVDPEQKVPKAEQAIPKTEQKTEMTSGSDLIPAKKKRKGRKPKVDAEELRKLFDEGKRSSELAEMYGVSTGTINKYLVQMRMEGNGNEEDLRRL